MPNMLIPVHLLSVFDNHPFPSPPDPSSYLCSVISFWDSLKLISHYKLVKLHFYFMNSFVLFGIVYSVAVSNVGRQMNHTDSLTKCCPLELCKLLHKTKTKNAMFLT